MQKYVSYLMLKIILYQFKYSKILHIFESIFLILVIKKISLLIKDKHHDIASILYLYL